MREWETEKEQEEKIELKITIQGSIRRFSFSLLFQL